MKRWKLIIGIALVFILGALAGSVSTGVYFKHRYPPRITDPEARKAFIMEKLSKELSLTQEQKAKIGEIVGQIEEKRRDYFIKRQAEIEKSVDLIRKELSSDQQKKYDALREKFEKDKKEREEGRFR
jgi:Spy/CpxP family protein refolding chaperone